MFINVGKNVGDGKKKKHKKACRSAFEPLSGSLYKVCDFPFVRSSVGGFFRVRVRLAHFLIQMIFFFSYFKMGKCPCGGDILTVYAVVVFCDTCINTAALTFE